ncbi:MAG: hypothetical protein JO301_11515 [Chitinophagaceae bacterium]|nr:hypothetical protein [Chitinophagaceae bacterium]
MKRVAMKKFTNVLLWIIVASVFTSCAALSKVIEPSTWLGLLDVAAAGAITVFIFRGVAK